MSQTVQRWRSQYNYTWILFTVASLPEKKQLFKMFIVIKWFQMWAFKIAQQAQNFLIYFYFIFFTDEVPVVTP